jgi:uroporphyrinogen-III synthase
MILYLGTDPTEFQQQHTNRSVLHYPIIQIVPRSPDSSEIRQAYAALKEYTHFIFTSKNAVNIFCAHLCALQIPVQQCQNKSVIAIGEVTAKHLIAQGLEPQFISEEETQEGMIEMLDPLDLREAYLFLPCSSLSRPVLTRFLEERRVRFQSCAIYDTVAQKLHPLPDLHLIEEIVFTSPSTVRAFLEIFGELPGGKKLTAIGPITQSYLSTCK